MRRHPPADTTPAHTVLWGPVPRFPAFSAPARLLPSSIFARLYERAAQSGRELFPFHIGDTHVAPPAAGRLGALGFSTTGDDSLYRYAPPAGDATLLEALVAKLRTKNGMAWADGDHVQVTCGAAHAFSCAARALLEPGEEILLLAPYWPLIRGIAQSVGARPIEVPFGHAVMRAPEADVEALLERHVTRATAALYVINPNNPDGKVLSDAEIEAIARFAIRHDLWVLADEVYEDFLYDGLRHRSLATVPGMAERTLTAFSFSKSYAQAGLRVGYLAGPPAPIANVRKLVNHTVYSVPRALQRAALAALTTGNEFLVETRALYDRARTEALARVAAPCARPQGGTYLFLDLTRWVDRADQSAIELLEQLAEAGVLVAPGDAFGLEFAKWARLCFTAVPLERLGPGIDRLNDVLAQAAR